MTGKPDIKMCIAISTPQEHSTTTARTNFEKGLQQKKKGFTQQLLKTLGLHLISVFQDISEQQFDFTNPQIVVNHTHNLIYEVYQGPACRDNKKQYPNQFYNL